MIFSSVAYVVFFAIYLIASVLTPSKWQLHLIILGSLVFYGYWNPFLVWVPALLCTLAFYGVLWIIKTGERRDKVMRLAIVISLLLLPLSFFKYNHFFYNEFLAPLANLEYRDLRVSLPLGISFITFTMISYVVDVYRGKFPAEKSIKDIAAYTLFFPQLIAGPILRPSELIPQLLRIDSRSKKFIGLGLTIFTVGLVKKVLFADSIAPIIDPVFSNPANYDLLTYWIAILGFTMQIYCDFSGYTDMAIGSALMLGIHLPLNFNSPYASYNLQDFWRNWHITLSKWLRDYLYIPLGGSRRSWPRNAYNIIITMLLGGLWHGANWTFVIWGALHGIGIVVVHSIRYIKPLRVMVEYMPNGIKWSITITFIMLTWVIFRSANMETALVIIDGAFSFKSYENSALFWSENLFPIVLIFMFALLHRFDSIKNVRLAYRKTPKSVLSVILIASWLISIALNFGSSNQFIYFDF